MKEKEQNKSAGFTLIELMVIVVILGILAAVIVPNFMGEPHKARVVKVQLEMEAMETALKRFYLDNAFYPSTEQGIQALVTQPTGGRTVKNYPADGYLLKVPNDPWGTPYIYISPGEHGKFDIVSLGADGVEGGSGEDSDLQSWLME